ncbi:MAG TPA: P-loop NTPase [Syntrophorhabdales bacterium]|nr:P-loop NTPase [Syntrophorhabdales bacterium]
MAADSISLRFKMKNEKAQADFEEALLPSNGFHIQKPGEFGSCDVLILEIGDDPDKDLQFASAVKTSGIARHVFLTAASTDPDILLGALRVGAGGFFAQPVNKEEVRNTLVKLKGQKDLIPAGKAPGRRGKIIDVFGGKGGVGTTTVAVNLATSLMEMDGVQTVGLVDINAPFSDIPLFLNIEPPIFDWMEVTKNINRLDSTYLMSILYKHASGVYVLPSPTAPVDDPNIPKVMDILIKLMRTMFDFIVVDSGQAIDETSRTILKLSDKVLLVTVLSLPSLINVKRFQSIFRKLGFPYEENVEVIVNRFNQKASVSMEEAEETLNKKIYFAIPNDYRITMSAINQGKPLSLVAYGAETATKMRGLASIIAGRDEKRRKRAFFGLR